MNTTTSYTLKPLSTGNGIVWRVLNAYGNEIGRRSTQLEAHELGQARA
jgi:hypothetical protein